MQRASFEDMNCSIARSLEVIGEWWTPLILRDAFLGVTRFDEFQRRLGIARNILATRLDRLVAEGIMERQCYDEARSRYDYKLTDKGRALWPILVMIRQWGDDWIVGKGNEPTVLRHRKCGQHARARLVCDHCGEELRLRDVVTEAGPGLTDPELLPSAAKRSR